MASSKEDAPAKESNAGEKVIYVWCARYGGCQQGFRVMRLTTRDGRASIQQIVHTFMDRLRFDVGTDNAVWTPFSPVRVLVPNVSGPFYDRHREVLAPSCTGGDMVNPVHWMPVDPDQLMFIEGTEVADHIPIGLESHAMESNPMVPPTLPGHIVVVGCHFPAYVEFANVSGLNGTPIFASQNVYSEYCRSRPFREVALLMNGVAHHVCSRQYEARLIDGHLRQVAMVGPDRQIQVNPAEPPWFMTPPTGPVPLAEWVSLCRLSEGPAASQRAIQAFLGAVAGIAGEFKKRGWQRFLVNMFEPKVYPKYGALCWELQNMKETDVKFCTSAPGYSPLTEHAKTAFHATQEAMLGPIFGIGHLVRGLGGYPWPWAASHGEMKKGSPASELLVGEDQTAYGCFCTPHFNSVSYTHLTLPTKA